MKPYSGGVRHDYKQTTAAAMVGRHFIRWRPLAIGAALPLLGVLVLFAVKPDHRATVSASPGSPILVGPAEEVALPLPPPPSIDPAPEVPAADPNAPPPLSLVVARGDTLERLFRRNGLSLNDLAAMVALPDAVKFLEDVNPGDRLDIVAHDGAVHTLTREIDEIRLLSIERDGTTFSATIVERGVDTRSAGAHGVIGSSLWEAGKGAGLSDSVIMALIGMFEWDIDFILEVRTGDQFTVVYEELWRDGVKLRNGEILAAEFVVQGEVFRAARYRDALGRTGHYTPEGRNVQKAFLRAPLEARVSSNFNLNRRHPVLNQIRAHRGVDYAAPTGTPVRAVGDGKVIFRGVQGGYGNTVIVQHGNNITTLYAHLSSFGNFRVGSRVKQKDVLGKVGATGLATGPHLHYEYRVDGVHRNPRTVTLPAAEPIPAEFQDDFRAQTANLWRQLDLYKQTTLATTAAN